MRDLTKSMMSFTWAMSVFGMKQIASLASPDGGRSAAASFDALTRATEAQLPPQARQAYRSGDQLQRGMVDASFGALDPGLLEPSRAIGFGIEILQRGVNALYELTPRAQSQPQGMSGWGAVPPPPRT